MINRIEKLRSLVFQTNLAMVDLIVEVKLKPIHLSMDYIGNANVLSNQTTFYLQIQSYIYMCVSFYCFQE